MIERCTVNSATGRWVLTATLLASGASFIMWSAVAVALPSIQSYFSTNIAGIQWVLNSHLLALSALLLIGGSLGDHYGRKKIFLAGMLLFAIGAVLSGFAWSIGVLIGFQALQGVGSALMVPQSLAIINACFQEEQRGRAIGLWAGLSGGIAALGPWLGGWLVEAFSWRAVFFMTVPVSLLAFIVTVVFVPENRDTSARKLDWWGTLLILLGLLGIAYGLITGPVGGWSQPLVLLGLIGGPVAIILFILTERRQAEPLVPLKIFRNPLVYGANTATLCLYFALNGAIFFTVLNLQQIQGYSPAVAGLGLLPPIVLITFLAGPAGAIADRIGPRPQMIGGPLIVALGIALLLTGGTDASYFRHFLPGLAILGLGMALVIAPLTKCALMVETRFSGAASGVNNAVARTAGLMAVAVLGAIAISTFALQLQETVNASALTVEEQRQIIVQSDKLGGIEIPDSFGQDARSVAQEAIRGSFVFGFRWAMGVCAALALAAAIISTITIHGPPRSQRQD
jgi:EmrB/QacA subfamily drug resistance transporter